MTIAADRVQRNDPRAAQWHALHCYLRWSNSDVDEFLTTGLGPLLDELRAGGRIEDWFFIRYSAGGAHLRIRVRAATPDDLETRLRAAVADCGYDVVPDRPDQPADWIAHGVVQTSPYEPETERYGGPDAVRVAERVFCRSSELALAVIAQTPDRPRRLAAATDVAIATAIALDLDAKDAARWLRTNAFTWRWHRRHDMVDPSRAQAPALAAAAAQAPAVVRRWQAIRTAVERGDGPAGRWAAVVRSARRDLETDGPSAWWLGVWASQLHMLNNRLGLLPDEERSLSWFLAACLLAPDGPSDYFADDASAVDRRYLDASRYVEARMPHQQPREAPRPEPLVTRNPFAGPSIALPAPEPLTATLADCLRDRASARGDLGPSITATELSTLLWSSCAPVPSAQSVRWGPGGAAEFRRRPYPSAGAQFTARLRVVARRVDGVEPGMYGVDPDARTLVPQSGAPDDDELVAASMWLVDSSPAHARIDVTRLPVLLGLYVELGALRVRYGLRAMRFALLEAGHLAQNIALVATAMGLSAGTVGGYYDDVAHELFMLDGIDDVLVYLMPLGRRR